MRRLFPAAGMAVVLHGLFLLMDGAWLVRGERPEATLQPSITIELLGTRNGPPSPAPEPLVLPTPPAFQPVRPAVVFPSPATPALAKPARHARTLPALPRTRSKDPSPSEMPRLSTIGVGKPDPAKTAPPSQGKVSPSPGFPDRPEGKSEQALPLVEAVPLYRENPPPAYPGLARRRGYEGVVLLDVLVSKEGRVGELQVARSSGYSLLDRAAIEAVEEWRFEPGRRGDRPVAMRVRVPVRFRLQ